MPGTAFIGLDFGSSLIKVAVRLEDVGLPAIAGSHRFGIAFRGKSHANRYSVFTENAVWVAGDGPDRRINLRHPDTNWPIKQTGIKEQLIDGYRPGEELRNTVAMDKCGLTPPEAAALLITSVLQDARTAIRDYVREKGGMQPSIVSVNCAIPSSDTLKTGTQDALSPSACPHRTMFLELVERTRRFVFVENREIAQLEMRLSAARGLAQAILAVPLPEDVGEIGTACLPESLAAVLAATAHPVFHEGLHFVFDIGAYTTDASLFHFHPGQHYRVMTYYATGSCRAGIGRDALPGTALPAHRVALLEGEIGAMYRAMAQDMMDCYGNNFLKMFRSEPLPWSPNWRATIIGGGAGFPAIEGVIGQLTGRSLQGDQSFPAPMPKRPQRFPRSTWEHVVFIHGTPSARVKSIQMLRRETLHFDAAIHRPAHLLQMSIGLTQNVLDCPPWSAHEVPTESHHPGSDADESWRRYNPWTGL